jgi:Phage integrase family
VQSAVEYAADVVAGTVDAGHLVHLACERFRRDLDEDTWEFRPEAERAMDFAGQMPNIKGIEAGRPLRLMPWQRLVFTNLFGFVEPGTNTRRFRQGVVFVPRGNGKDHEGGAEGYAAAVTRIRPGSCLTRLTWRFAKIVKQAGVKRISFHGLRHTHATDLLRAGVHPKIAPGGGLRWSQGA